MGTVDLFGILLPTEVAVVIIGEIVIAALFVTAVLMAATHRGWYHHYLILSGFLLDELVMKPIMYSRLSLGVLGSFPYNGTSGIPHLALAFAASALGIAAIFLAFRYRIKKNRKMFLPLRGRIHRYVGACYLIAWLATLIVGLQIFGTFYLH